MAMRTPDGETPSPDSLTRGYLRWSWVSDPAPGKYKLEDNMNAFEDRRGQSWYIKPSMKPAQINIVRNRPNVFRGFHLQEHPLTSKWIMLIAGVIIDMYYDLKTNTLDYEVLYPGDSFFVPNTAAHAFYSPGNSVMMYLMDSEWVKEGNKTYKAPFDTSAMTLSDNDRHAVEELPIDEKNKEVLDRLKEVLKTCRFGIWSPPEEE